MDCLTGSCERSVPRRGACCLMCSQTSGREHGTLCEKKRIADLSTARVGPDPDRDPDSVFAAQPRHKRAGLTTDRLSANLHANHYGPATKAHPGTVEIQCEELHLATGDMGRKDAEGSAEYSGRALEGMQQGKPITRNRHGYFEPTEPWQFDFLIRDARARQVKWGVWLAAALHAQKTMREGRKLWE